MIQIEYVEDGKRIRHYSDQLLKIKQIETNKLYNDAVDVIPCIYTYEETNIPIEYYEEEIDDSEALQIIIGKDKK